MVRINKYIASCGGASRRSAEKLILENKVKVNGKIVNDLSTQIDETKDTVIVDGKTIKPIKKNFYLMFHKPKGVITTVSDEKGRKTVMDFLPPYLRNIVKPVGRLDRDSEGLLLLTNDGELNRFLTHPSSKIEKHYIVAIEGEISDEEIKTLTSGVKIESNGKEVQTSPLSIKVLEVNEDKKQTRLEVVLDEGKNREIRKLFESINKTIVLLKRTQIGKLTLGGLPRGTYKDFDPKWTK